MATKKKGFVIAKKMRNPTIGFIKSATDLVELKATILNLEPEDRSDEDVIQAIDTKASAIVGS